MKRILFALALVFGAPALAEIPDPPPLNGKPLVDQADLLTADQEDEVNRALLDIQANTHHQVAVLTVPNLNGIPAQEYATHAFRTYKLGSKERNDGVLLLVSMANPRRIQIEVGYGLEGVLTDADSGRIARDMAPLMKAGDYRTALLTGVSAINSEITEEVVTAQQIAERNANRANDGKPIGLMIILLVVLVVALIAVFVTISNRRAERARYEAERRYRSKGGSFHINLDEEPSYQWDTTPIHSSPRPAYRSTVTPIAAQPVSDDTYTCSSSWNNSTSNDTWSSPSSTDTSSFSGDGGASGGGGGGADF